MKFPTSRIIENEISYFQPVNPKLHKHITDQELLERFYTDHDNQWLGILLERYTLLLLGVCMKYLKDEEQARDSVQQIFLKAITELHKYRVDYFKSWIYMVAKNHCLMQLRDKPGKNTVEVKDNIAAEAIDADKESLILNEKTYEYMSEALKELNADQQLCVTLFYMEKKSYQQIAEQTGYNMMQVKSHIQNGKRNMRILIEKKLSQ
ncbi:MAG TPA: sigma-70 family RNA polymerase sigma factor [Chitinophagaceae bacterium]|nr:sigma-70 family RNA polymerase sigma factor [Chitinophagaceae bacterium]